MDSPFKKKAFIHTVPLGTPSHNVELPQGKSARVLFTLQEMDEGGEPF